MSKPIVPDSGPCGKSNPVQKKIKNKSRVLSGFIEDTERTIEALESWLNELKQWQYQEKVSLEAFEGAYAIIRSAGLGEWVKMGIDELRTAVTGEVACGSSHSE
jgi:hypothetical protein